MKTLAAIAYTMKAREQKRNKPADREEQARADSVQTKPVGKNGATAATAPNDAAMESPQKVDKGKQRAV